MLKSITDLTIDREIIDNILKDIKDPHLHRPIEYLFDMIDRQNKTITSLRNKVLGLEKIVNKSKSGPKSNSTKTEDNVINRPICEILMEEEYYVFIIGKDYEYVDEAFIINKKDMENMKIVKNNIYISKTIVSKIDIHYLKESTDWDYIYEQLPLLSDLESKDDDELDDICKSYQINIKSVKTKKTKIKRINVFYDNKMSYIYVLHLPDELLKKFNTYLHSKLDKKIVDVMEINIINTFNLDDVKERESETPSLFKGDYMVDVDFENQTVYKETKKIGYLISCGDLTKDVPIRYGTNNYLVMDKFLYYGIKYIICLFSGYTIKRSEYRNNMDNVIKYKLYMINKSNTMCSKSKTGLCFTSGKIPYIIGEIINVNNKEHIRDLHEISENVYPVYENGILMDYNVSWDNDNWGVNYIINVEPLHGDISPRQNLTLQSKHLNGNIILMKNSNESILLRVNKENSYIIINQIHYIIATKIIYNDDTWFVCNFTGVAIKEDDYIISEDNIINTKLYLLNECDLFIDDNGIYFSDDSKGFIITKQKKLKKKLCLVEAYDKKAKSTYTLSKNGFIIKN